MHDVIKEKQYLSAREKERGVARERTRHTRGGQIKRDSTKETS